MARSMTGFGSGEAELAGGRLSLELRSVNHRHLDLRLNLPVELSTIAFDVEQRLRAKLGRGRFDVTARVDGTSLASGLDRGRARAAFRALADLRDELAPGAELPLGLLGSVPELFRSAPAYDRDALLAAFDVASIAANADLTRRREVEGRALAGDMRTHLAVARDSCAAIAREAPTVVESHRQRLRERIRRLLDADVALDPGRLEQEIAIAADRCDVSEELARLSCHFDQLEAQLDKDGPIGRKIDFLLQEMSREANTVGSKSQSAVVAQAVVELRTAIERIREQAQNLE